MCTFEDHEMALSEHAMNEGVDFGTMAIEVDEPFIYDNSGRELLTEGEIVTVENPDRLFDWKLPEKFRVEVIDTDAVVSIDGYGYQERLALGVRENGTIVPLFAHGGDDGEVVVEPLSGMQEGISSKIEKR